MQDLEKKIQTIKDENIGLQREVHAKDQQIGKCQNVTTHL